MPPAAIGIEVVLSPIQDRSIFEELPNKSSGAGQFMFAGVTADSNIRRGLIMFDINASIPQEATIPSATLALTVAKAPDASDTATPQSIYRASRDRGIAESAGRGTGELAEEGDTTWLQNFHSF